MNRPEYVELEIRNKEHTIIFLVAGDQAGYGSLDRGLLRRSRGRNRPGLLQAELERDR